MLSGALKSPIAKPLLFVVCLIPFALLIWAIFNDDLGANPIEKLTRETGRWTLRFLLITLAVSPLRQWTGVAALGRFRRMLGLFVFFYCSCHILIWLVFDHSLNPADMLEDILERPYITFGFSAFVLLIPLAVTSNQAMIRRLGKRWKRLHQLVYLIILLGVLHFLWLVKADYMDPIIYSIIMVVLLLHRIDPIKRLSAKSYTLAG